MGSGHLIGTPASVSHQAAADQYFGVQRRIQPAGTRIVQAGVKLDSMDGLRNAFLVSGSMGNAALGLGVMGGVVYCSVRSQWERMFPKPPPELVSLAEQRVHHPESFAGGKIEKDDDL